MIQGFEHRTAPLTDDEKKLLQPIIKGLHNRQRKDHAITGALICKRINHLYNSKLTTPRLRKIINFIRSAGILPVMANSKGYYVSYDQEDIKEQIYSLEQRKQAIDVAIQGLKKHLKDG